MIGFIRDLRLVPIAVVASACLLALVAVDLLLGHGVSLTADPAPGLADATVVHVVPGAAQANDAQRSWAQQMFNYPDANGGAAPAPRRRAELPQLTALAADKGGDIITGSVADASEETSTAKGKDEAGAAASGAPRKDVKNAAPPNGRVIPADGPPQPSPAERAILERLTERRQELDKRARELDIREGLIAEAEKRVEARLAEIKSAQAQLAVAAEQKNEAEAARFKGLVTMYENMKPRDAAKIFDRLDVGVLIEVASQINPRNMSEILAQMSPDTAERLTVELASRAKAVSKGASADLPKIEGRPARP